MERPARSLLSLLLASGAGGLLVLAVACGEDKGETPDRITTPVPTDGAARVDGAPRREAGVPTKCATYSGSTSSDICACGEAQSPYTGPATDKCPAKDAPHYCISYDVVDPPPLRRECTCTPKCAFQKVKGGSSGGDAGGDVDTCRCGVSSHLVLGGEGSVDEARASCDGFAVCCRGSAGCDCTSDPTYTCATNTQKVPSCGPDDFNSKIWKAVVYGSPSLTDLVDVDRCR